MKFDYNSTIRIGHKAKSVIVPWSQLLPMTFGKIPSPADYSE